MDNTRIAEGLLWFVAFLFSTTVHEAAHAFVAWRGGDPTAHRRGQVSLSPTPHIRREPIGMLVVPLLTAVTQGWAIGWASTPYDPLWEARYPRRAALMAAAGPAANLLLAFLAFGAIKGGLSASFFARPETATFSQVVAIASSSSIALLLGKVLSIFLMLNVLLCVFNLLPFPPLDGGSAIGLALPDSMAEKVRNFSRKPGFSILGILIAWQVFPHIARPLFGLVLTVLYPGAHYG